MPPAYNVTRRPRAGVGLAKVLANRRRSCAATFSTLYSGGRGARAPHPKISHSQLRKVFSLNIVEAQYVTMHAGCLSIVRTLVLTDGGMVGVISAPHHSLGSPVET